MTTDELNAIVQAVMLEMEKAGVDFDFKAETPQPTDLVYVMRGTSDKYQGITVKWQNLLDIIVKKATDAKDEAVSAKDIALQTLATIQSIESNVSTMKTSVETTKSQVETMKGEVSTMKASVEGTKTEVEGLKSDVTALKSQTQTIVDNAKEDVTGLLDTKVSYSDSLSYEEIMATNPVPDLTNKVSSASALKELGGTDWVQVSDNIRCKKIGNVKFVQVKSIAGTKETWTNIGTLPAEYCPLDNVTNPFMSNSQLSAIATCMITTYGQVKEWCYTDNITQSGQYNINFMYM